MGFLKKSGPVEWLLVCLGNPGKQYENTRHNIGFMAADLLSEREGVKLNKLRYRALTGEMTLGGARVLVIKPQTYMNLSGEAVKLAGGFYKVPPERVLVISDDVSLPLGKLRIRASGSAGGHNGLKNIIAHLGTDAFPRIKVGVGAPAHPEHEMVDWVIGNFSGEEKKVVRQALERVTEAVECVVAKGVGEAQNRYN
ncbi:MAG: aminoacyl-tRNA hydrolase [Oscillospiraceae bacterium]|jgi:PTH1 family peptidyl-tRNA hydrolase|nr:aminoacyl-tRNA hydrolase [Oscillospiraceae bacterium]